MATEFITKNNGRIIMKFHGASRKCHKPFTEAMFPGRLPMGFRCIVYVTKDCTIAQYKSNCACPVDFGKYYHRPVTLERVLALMQEAAGYNE